MNKPYLEITFRRGKPFAGYLFLQRQSGDCVTRSNPAGIFVIDYAANGRPIGIEITGWTATVRSDLERLLRQLQIEDVPSAELAPLEAA